MTVQTKDNEEYTFDFVVIGGGLAGFCAAVAAARRGAKTAIVQDRPVFGGNSSSEIRVAPVGSASINAWTRETGILEELLLEERKRNYDDIHNGTVSSHYDLVLYEVANREQNLTVFMNTSIRGVEVVPANRNKVEGERRIAAVHGSQLANEKELVLKAGQFADCTGDATVGALAGAEFMYGRESRNEFNENLAPVTKDDQCMGSTITMRARNIGRPVPFDAPRWIKEYKTLDEIGTKRFPGKFNRVDYGGYWWIEIGSPYHQIDDNQKIKEELLCHVLGVWNYVKNYSPEKKDAEHYALEWVGMVAGKRESRRLVGDVILAEKDCHRDQCWPDTVCYAGWFIDLHIMGGILNKREPAELAMSDAHYRCWVRIPPWSIPLRALYSRNIENLWMAGRNISVTHVALGSTRVMMTHALQGQAIGTAAEYASSNGLTARQAADPESSHVNRIQQQLLKDDVHVMGIKNSDPDDLALDAEVTATSDAPLDFGEADLNSLVPLDVPRCQVFPVSTDYIGSLSFYIKNENKKSAEIDVELQKMERIWDRHNGKTLAKVKAEVNAGFKGWITVKIDTDIEPDRPYRVILFEKKGISWVKGTLIPVGTNVQFLHTCPGGCEPENSFMPQLQLNEIKLPEYELWSPEKKKTMMSLRIDPVQRPYTGSNVNNGYAWPFVMPNLWISDPEKPLPQSIELIFNKEKEFNTVLVSFDTNLLLVYHEIPGLWKAPSCCLYWRLYARIDGSWDEIYEEKGNYLRRRKAEFNRVRADALKLEVLKNNDTGNGEGVAYMNGNGARVYEIRIYNEK